MSVSITYPDKWVRKAVKARLAGLTIGSDSISTHDYNVGKSAPKYYVLLSAQSSTELLSSKCGRGYLHSLLIQCIARYGVRNRSASRTKADDIADAVRAALNSLALDPASGLVVNLQTLHSEADFQDRDDAGDVFRKVLRLELTIN